MIRPALAAGLSLTLAACGFTPLYGDTLQVAPALSSIDVDAPATRTGQLLREELDDELASASAPARYRLMLDVSERRYPRGLRVDDTANRYETRVTVGYQLIDASDRRVLVRSSRPVFVTYDVADAPYAGIAAGQDGQERAASEAARLIRLDLARFFAGRAP